MIRIACCLMLFPLIANAQDDAATGPRQKVVSVEVTILEISGELKVADPAKIDDEKLKEAVRAAREAGILQHLTRVRLSTLELQEAMVQLGESQNVVVGRQGFGQGAASSRVATSYREEQTGTLISVTPRITEKGDIILDLQIEQTRLRPPPAAGGDDGSRLTLPGKATLTLQTIVRVAPGQGTLISGAQRVNADTKQLQTHVIVRVTTCDEPH